MRQASTASARTKRPLPTDSLSVRGDPNARSHKLSVASVPASTLEARFTATQKTLLRASSSTSPPKMPV